MRLVRSSKTVQEYLEKNYSDEEIKSDEYTIKLALKALLEVNNSSDLEIRVEHHPWRSVFGHIFR